MVRGPRYASRDLEIRGVVAVRAGDEGVLARAGRCQVVDRLAAAHHPRLGLHGKDLEPAAVEDPLVRVGMLLEAHVEPGLVTVERVRVLHHELPHAQQAAAGTGLVPALRLEVVEDLRQVAVGAELGEMERHRLLVRHREHERPARAVGQPEELGDPVAAGRLPELGGRDHRHRHLLTADRVHFLPHDLHDPLVRAPAGRKEAPEPGAHLADHPRADEQLVRDSFRIRGVVSKSREEQLRLAPDHEAAGYRSTPWASWGGAAASARVAHPPDIRARRTKVA